MYCSVQVQVPSTTSVLSQLADNVEFSRLHLYASRSSSARGREGVSVAGSALVLSIVGMAGRQATAARDPSRQGRRPLMVVVSIVPGLQVAEVRWNPRARILIFRQSHFRSWVHSLGLRGGLRLWWRFSDTARNFKYQVQFSCTVKRTCIYV